MAQEISLYRQYEAELQNYYGTGNDPLAYAPPVRDRDVAHTLALQVEAYMSGIDEEEIAASAARALRREPLRQQTPEKRAELENEARAHRLRMAVVNVELTHARLAPGDFNPDQEQAGAYEMGIGLVLPPSDNA